MAFLIVVALLVGGWARDGSAHSPSPSTSRAAVVVDTDMSWDDIVALTFLLRSPRVDVNAIAVSGTGLTHCGPGVRHVRELVRYLGHVPVPVACGRTTPLAGFRSFPLAWRSQADRFFGLRLAPPRGRPARSSAVAVLAGAVRASSRTTIIELAPMTNVAELALRYPQLSHRVREVVAMAGAFDVPGNVGSSVTTSEYNVYIDAKAAGDVLQWRGVRKLLVPLDACDDVPVTPMFEQAVSAAGNDAPARLLATLLRDPYYTTGSQYFWDPAAAVVATDRGVATEEAERVAVVQQSGAEHGRTIRAPRGAITRVVTNLDPKAFFGRLLAVLTANPTAKLPEPAQRLAISRAGDRWSVAGGAGRVAGTLALTVENESPDPIGVAVARIGAGHSVKDADALLKVAAAGGPMPDWIRVVLQVTVPVAHPATFGARLVRGLYVVVGGGNGLPLRRLAAIDIQR